MSERFLALFNNNQRPVQASQRCSPRSPLESLSGCNQTFSLVVSLLQASAFLHKAPVVRCWRQTARHAILIQQSAFAARPTAIWLGAHVSPRCTAATSRICSGLWPEHQCCSCGAGQKRPVRRGISQLQCGEHSRTTSISRAPSLNTDNQCTLLWSRFDVVKRPVTKTAS